MKTMAIRLSDDLHTQLTLVATLEGLTITDVIRASVTAYIEERKELLSSKAEEALAEIERDAAARREALASLFGGAEPTNATEEAPGAGDEPTPRNPRGRRGGASG